MRTSSLRLATVSLLFLAACGSSIETSGSSGTASGSGGGGAASSTGTTSTSGTGGGSSTSTSSSSGAGGEGGSGGCYIDLVQDSAAPSHLTSICQGSFGADKSSEPVGYFISGGPFPGVHKLVIQGCADMGAQSHGIQLSADDAMGTGTFTMGTTYYTDLNGGDWGVAGDPFSMTVTKLEDVGGVIEGTFDVMVTHGGSAAYDVSGSFHACRVPDLLAP